MSLKQSIAQQKRAESFREYIKFIISKLGYQDSITLDEYPKWSVYFDEKRDWMPEDCFKKGEPYDGTWNNSAIENAIAYSEIKKDMEK